MDTMTQKKYEARAAVMKALAHPTRLYMVEELQKGAQCVCKLQELIGADMSTVSKHLSVLKSAGLVYDKKEGTTVYYFLKNRLWNIHDRKIPLTNILKQSPRFHPDALSKKD